MAPQGKGNGNGNSNGNNGLNNGNSGSGGGNGKTNGNGPGIPTPGNSGGNPHDGPPGLQDRPNKPNDNGNNAKPPQGEESGGDTGGNDDDGRPGPDPGPGPGRDPGGGNGGGEDPSTATRIPATRPGPGPDPPTPPTPTQNEQNDLPSATQATTTTAARLAERPDDDGGVSLPPGSSISTVTTTEGDGRTVIFTTLVPTGGQPPTVNGAPGPPPQTRAAIAATLSLAFVAALAALFVLRKRKIQKREKKKTERRKWWFNKRRPSSRDYQDEKRPTPIDGGAEESTGWARPSPSLDVKDLPAMPPMAEVRKGSSSTATDDRYPITPEAGAEPTRFSLGSLISFGSSSSVSGKHGIIIEGSSINTGSDISHGTRSDARSSYGLSSSARPPLPEEQGIAYHGAQRAPGITASSAPTYLPVPPSLALDRRLSSSTGTAESGSVSLDLGFGPPTSPLGPRSRYDLPSQYDFAGPSRQDHKKYSMSSTSSIPSPRSPPSPAPFRLSQRPSGRVRSPSSSKPSNPFVDPRQSLSSNGHRSIFRSSVDDASVSIIASSCYGDYEEFETVRSPFIGNLSDEISLRRGDEVRVLKVFSDGWALVEKSSQDMNDVERGMIPFDCLRDGAPRLRLSAVGLVGGDERGYPARVDSYTAGADSSRRL